MHLHPTTLFLFWFGGGFVIFLVWAALVGEALMGDRPRAVRRAIGLLALLGLVHPAAGAGAVDLVRLTRSLAEPPTDDLVAASDLPARQARVDALTVPGWASVAVVTCAAVGVVVAAISLIRVGGIS